MNHLLEKVDEPTDILPAGTCTTSDAASIRSARLWFVEKTAYVLIFAFLIAIRIPDVLKGRLWAEEGTVFFASAWNLPWEKALWVSYGGYLNITANLAGILAVHTVRLENACFVTSCIGLLIQCFPVVLLCLSRDKWLQDRKCLLGAMLLTATLPASQEIWLSTIGSQCHLNLCVALILALSPESGWSGLFQKLLLVVAPLSGPGAALLLPLFALRAFVDRSKARVIQTTLLGLAAAMQFAFFFHPAARQGLGLKADVLGIDPGLLLNIFFVKHLLLSFLGADQTTVITAGWGDAYAASHVITPQGIVVSIVVLLVLGFGAWRSKQTEPRWLYLSGVLLFGVSNFGALGVRAALLNVGLCERYVFAPQILFELTLLAIAYATHGWRKSVASGMIIWLLVIGAHEYFWTPNYYAHGPVWKEEVKLWRKDHSYKLNIWPKDWTVLLDQPQKQD